MNKTNPSSNYDITIVGAGAFGTAVLGQLSLLQKTTESFRILVVERMAKLGSGLPYSEEMNIPEYIMNIAGGCTQITATYIPMSKRSDFIEWLKSLTREYRASIGVPESQSNTDWVYRPFPRKIVGLYLQDRFNSFCDALTRKGFEVDLRNHTEAISVQPADHDSKLGYEIKLDDESKVFTHVLFIATGHWSYNRYPHFSAWIPSVYPPRVLQERSQSKTSIGILGCSLSAIDAALALGKAKGDFQQIGNEEQRKLVFLPHPGEHQFKMIMYGRKAILPQVLGVGVNKIFSYKQLIPEKLMPIIQVNNGQLPLDELWSLLKKEIYDEVPHLHPHFPEDWENILLEEAVNQLDMYLQETDYKERLNKETEDAKESLKSGIPLPLQNVFFQSYAIFDELLTYFTAEDRLRFENVKTELHLLLAPFPVQNAEKILALMQGGFLEIQKLGTQYTITETPESKQIKISWTERNQCLENTHDLVIDALGQCSDFDKDSSPLTTSLKKHNLLKEVLVPFDDLENAQNHSEHPRVVKRDGVYYYRPDGACIDKQNYSLVPSTDATSACPVYYMGPFTQGQVAFPQDLSVVTTAAESSVSDLVKRKILKKDTDAISSEDPRQMDGDQLNAKGDLDTEMRLMTEKLKRTGYI
ncbi:uncharacterized protein LOC114537765 [Dendronephthya gigantea]|uniref:uncharacterized protein LOC114537765 n=1 Tax=Dendronephthya gigantea TaxID=151771 RepID=UPI00106D35F8|nr:uncharacterized protein LOC114537765 [Dendronephthya gigantea]